MRLIQKAFLLVFLDVCFSTAIIAQDIDRIDPKSNDITIDIPPLSVLIDSAYLQDAMLKFREQDVAIRNCDLKADKRYWLRNIGVQTDVRYGTFDHFSTNASDGEVPVNTAITSTDTRYGFGAYLRLPLSDVVNRKNQIKIGQLEVDKAESMAETQRELIRQKVITQYNNLLLQLRLFKIKVKQLETARMNMQMSEKEFINGVIPVKEYARLSDIFVGVESNYEIAKSELMTSLMLLEDLTGMKFKVNQSFPLTNENN